MKKHFVEFYSPGTFFSEVTQKPISSWDVDKALKLVKGIKERYDAVPYGFRFITRERNDDELDSKQTAQSSMYYLGGKIETLEEVKARATKDDQILISNMKNNGWKRIITNTNSWKTVQPLEDNDVVLDWKQEKQ